MHRNICISALAMLVASLVNGLMVLPSLAEEPDEPASAPPATTAPITRPQLTDADKRELRQFLKTSRPLIERLRYLNAAIAPGGEEEDYSKKVFELEALIDSIEWGESPRLVDMLQPVGDNMDELISNHETIVSRDAAAFTIRVRLQHEPAGTDMHASLTKDLKSARQDQKESMDKVTTGTATLEQHIKELQTIVGDPPEKDAAKESAKITAGNNARQKAGTEAQQNAGSTTPTTTRPSAKLDPPYLSEMPSVEQVMKDMKVEGDPDRTAARRANAFDELWNVIATIAGARGGEAKLTDDESRIWNQYSAARFDIAMSFSTPSARSAFVKATNDPSNRVHDEVFKRYFSASFRAAYDKAKAAAEK